MASHPQHHLQVENVTDIFGSAIGLTAAIGEIYSVRYDDDSCREIFIWGDPSSKDYEGALFLKPGRKGRLWDEVRSLMTKDVVPPEIAGALRKYDEARSSSAETPGAQHA